MTNLDFYKKAKEEGTVLTGIVKMLEYNKERETDILTVDMEDNVVLIEREETDIDGTGGSLLPLIGQNIKFTILDVTEEGLVFGTRKVPQKAEREKLAEFIREQGTISVKVLNLNNFGAYVQYKGVTGVLRNADFSSDHTTVGQVYKNGDTLDVQLLRLSSNGRLYFELKDKYESSTAIDFDVFERDQFVLGNIRTLKPWGVFVNIAPGIDALCSLPQTVELEEGMKVSAQIKVVDKEKRRVRARILRVIDEETEESEVNL